MPQRHPKTTAAEAGKTRPAAVCVSAVEGAAHAKRVLARDMGVDHRRAQVGMAEQVLDGADVGAALQ